MGTKKAKLDKLDSWWQELTKEQKQIIYDACNSHTCACGGEGCGESKGCNCESCEGDCECKK